jgi:predicted short-subunit dehydrogenase-like oxidoreductase (DUF2520 family)
MTKHLSRSRKPTVSIVGAGRVGQALALALGLCGYPIVALVARRRQKAEKASRLLPNANLLALGAGDLHKLPASDLIVIATPDDEIEPVAKALSNSQANGARGRIVLHTSGALSSEILSPLAKVGFHTGSMHPLVSISDPRSGAEALAQAFFCLEGDPRAVRLAHRLVRDLGGKSFSVASEAKPLYHAAAVMASPHLVALFDLATEMLSACGVRRQEARKVLLPLVASTVNNLQDFPADKALTGTFARGDVATVRRHLKALSGKGLERALEVYKMLGRQSLELARKNGLDEKIVKSIRALLDSQ